MILRKVGFLTLRYKKYVDMKVIKIMNKIPQTKLKHKIQKTNIPHTPTPQHQY